MVLSASQCGVRCSSHVPLTPFLSWQQHTCLHPHELKENELVTKLYIGDDPTFKETSELVSEEKQLMTSQNSWHHET